MTSKTVLSPPEVAHLFDRISSRYDRFNHVASFGMDQWWRRSVVSLIPDRADVLDIGCGTGALTVLASRRIRDRGRVIGLDFSADMLDLAQRRHGLSWTQGRCGWIRGSALQVPFASDCFDVVTSAFVLRNVRSHLSQVLEELLRVLRPGGCALMLDLACPSISWLRGGHRWYLRRMIPKIGRWVTGHPEPFSYLSDSILESLTADEIEQRMRETGFVQAGFRPLYGGVAGIYWGEKNL